MSNRVVITGIGVISSIGYGIEEFTESLKKGKSGISRIQSFNTEGFPSYYGGEIHNLDLSKFITNQCSSDLGRTARFAVVAAKLAVEDAEIDLSTLSGNHCGVCVGTTDGEVQTIQKIVENEIFDNNHNLSESLIENVAPHNIPLSISRELNLEGENLAITTACAAGNYAVGYGYDLVKRGKQNVMLCGGAESFSLKTFAGFSRLGSMAPFVCQPFDADRKGLILGEGSCFLLIENLDHAIERGAKIYAEVLGYGLSCDASHMTASKTDGIIQATLNAYKNAGINPEDIDYISAHGTGTKHNDFTEISAMRSVFGEKLPPVSSIKSMIGHTLGAASAFSLAACAVALKDEFIPPTINFLNKDPNIDVDCVPNYSRKQSLKVIQNNAFAFGGNNAIVILRRYENGF